MVKGRHFYSISDEQLLELLRKKAQELGRRPTGDEIDRDPRLPSHQLYKKRFHSLKKAFVATGVRDRRAADRRKATLKLLKTKAEELGRAPRLMEILADPRFPNCHHTMKKLVGPYRKALRSIGCEPSPPKVFYSDEKLVRALRLKAEELGRVPYRDEISADPRLPNGRTVEKRFGGYGKALEKAGLIESYFPALSDEEILELFVEKARRLGRPLRKRDLDDDHKMPPCSLIYKRFGSLSRVNFVLGFRAWGTKEVFEKDLKRLIVQFFEENGHVPTMRDFEEDPALPWPLGAVQKLDKTWNQVLSECELDIHTHGRSQRNNRRAELLVKESLLKAGYEVEDMTEKNSQIPFGFLVNGRIRVQVSCAHTWFPKRGNPRWIFWGLNREYYDYLVGVGFDEDDDPAATFVFPTDEMEYKHVSLMIRESGNSGYFVSDLRGVLR